MTEMRTQVYRGCRFGFSMAEILVSIVIVSGMLVAALNTLAATKTAQLSGGQDGIGHLLALDLMSEILPLPYADPDQTPAMGLEAGESGTSREAFDDVDDYDGWCADPPRYVDGTEVSGYNGWKRCVVVEFAEPTNVTATALSDKGVKRITVVASHGGGGVVQLVSVRTGTPASLPVRSSPPMGYLE